MNDDGEPSDSRSRTYLLALRVLSKLRLREETGSQSDNFQPWQNGSCAVLGQLESAR